MTASTADDRPVSEDVVVPAARHLPAERMERERIARRFWAKVEKSPSCWLWRGAQKGIGYGNLVVAGANFGAHRVAYELEHGDIPAGLQIDHMCDVKLCVRPDHLRLATNRENNLRTQSVAAINARKTHCSRGHELVEPNVRITKRQGGIRRNCRQCGRERTAEWKRDHPGYYADRQRLYRSTPEGKRHHNDAVIRYNARNPAKRRIWVRRWKQSVGIYVPDLQALRRAIKRLDSALAAAEERP